MHQTLVVTIVVMEVTFLREKNTSKKLSKNVKIEIKLRITSCIGHLLVINDGVGCVKTTAPD